MSWGCLQELDVESGSRRTWDLSSNEVSVGRMTQTKADDKLTIKWPKAYISGHHFSIKRSKEGEMCELFDHSSNGTFKNGELIGKGKSSELRNGDIIQLRFKQVDKIILTFIIFSVDNSDSVNDKSSNKRKRVKTEEEADDKACHRRDADNLSFIRISALEQDNKQQEARIEAYITKLETSARENSNLLRELKAAKDDAQEKGSQLEELKQQCLVQEAHTATIEARVHKLEENLQAQKANTEKLRCQLAISEEKSAQTNELLLKVETLSDELKHRKSQNDSRSTICDELSLSLDNEKKLKEAVELQLDDCKDALAHSRTEALHLKHLNDVLKEEQSHTNSKLRESQAKIELLEAMARQVKIEEESNVAVFKRQFAAISASFDQLQAEVTSFGNSFPPQPTRATIESCFLAMEQLQDSAAIEKVEGQQQQQDGGDQDAPSCTQVHTPDRMKKTVSGDSTIAFSKSSAENLECTEMISTEMPKAGLTANSEYRQCSMYDTISMTEEGVDMEKIEEDVLMQHNAMQHHKERAATTSSNCTDVSPSRVEHLGISASDESSMKPIPEKVIAEQQGHAVEEGIAGGEGRGGSELQFRNDEGKFQEDLHDSIGAGGGESSNGSESDDSSMVICDNNRDGDVDDSNEYDVEEDREEDTGCASHQLQ